MGPHILICGGAGYIGSHMVRLLLDKGFEVTVFDNLSTGHRQAVGAARLVEGDLLDAPALAACFRSHAVDAVLHFAARSQVGESVREPLPYYRNNVVGSLNLLAAMQTAGVGQIVFSSTAAVYGVPRETPITETTPLDPINPYGASKAMVERMLRDAALAQGLRAVSLRYFNAAGAHPSGEIGEAHEPETHVIPRLLQTAAGESEFRLFGSGYPTRDGTCVRDYVHVCDLAQAHLLALHYLQDHPGVHVFNLGNGQGFSVREVVAAAREVTGRKIAVQEAPARPGDPPTLVASSRAAQEQLGWRPEWADLKTIIASAWRWHRERRY